MARTNYKSHNFKTYVLTIDGDTVATGLQSISWEKDDDEISYDVAADGTVVEQENNSETGMCTFSVQEASPTNAKMWALRANKTKFSITGADSNIPDYAASGAACRVLKAPTLERTSEASYVEWTVKIPYLDIASGGYSLESI